MNAKHREHRPPKDIFGSGAIVSILLAAGALCGMNWMDSNSLAQKDAKIASLYESCAPGAPDSALVRSIGLPSSKGQMGRYEVWTYDRPAGFDFEINALVRDGKVFRLFTLETEAHAETMRAQLENVQRNGRVDGGAM